MPVAREDLKPWNKMAGGVIDDTLSEVKPVQKIVEHLTDEHAAPQARHKQRRDVFLHREEAVAECLSHGLPVQKYALVGIVIQVLACFSWLLVVRCP